MDFILGWDLLRQVQGRSVGTSRVDHRAEWLPGGNLLIVVAEDPVGLSVSAVVLTRADLQVLAAEAARVEVRIAPPDVAGMIPRESVRGVIQRAQQSGMRPRKEGFE